MRKIGIFGGTFNPVHNGHINIAKTAKDSLGLDFVIMLPSGNPPHKKGEDLLDAGIRHIMLKLAVGGMDGLVPCDYEVKREEYSYTVNTLEFFKRIYPDDELYFIMGGDSIDYFDKWYMPEEIVSYAKLVVYGRGKEHNIEFIEGKFSTDVLVLEGDFIDISSTEIRQNKEHLKESVPQKVYDFINKYNLYEEKRPDMDILKEYLKDNRLSHSIGVSKMAKELAKIYGVNEDIAERAGLLHDIAKYIPMDEALLMCNELEAQIDPVERWMPPLIHAKLGAELVKCLFSIKEGEITSAIRWHTIGKTNMTTLQKIIFVADMIEDGRDFPGVQKIRETALYDLDMAVLYCIQSSINYNSQKGNKIHPLAYRIRDEILGKKDMDKL